MLLFLLAYGGGVLTILSPCILPILPFVFARGDKPFLRSGLPLLLGMALTFALVASLAALGGGWAVEANRWGRWVAVALLGFFGLTLLIPSLSERMTRPLVRLGSRLSERAGAPGKDGIGTSLLLGVATGLLWAPCAGPILGLILTGAALGGASVGTSVLLLAYALGAATSLALALLVGGRVFRAMKRGLGAGEWIRRALGVLVLAGVAAIALGLDTGYLARLSTAQTDTVERGLARTLGMAEPEGSTALGAVLPDGRLTLPVEGELPPLTGATAWLNSPPLTREGLRGRVVLIDFWTYSCINCLRSIPHVKRWHERYADKGLVVIGVHAPEFAFEKSLGNVRNAVRDLGIPYPVALDNDFAIWRAFNNRYWPAHYFVDAEGRVRAHAFGEGHYDTSERVIRELIRQSGRDPGPPSRADLEPTGVGLAADRDTRLSPETYLGFGRAEHFASPGGLVRDRAADYRAAPLQRNGWFLDGNWTVREQSARPNRPGGRIGFQFHARDLHLVLGPGDGRLNGKRFRVLLDGKPPGADAGLDVAPDGTGVVREERLYQLVRQKGAVRDRLFTIEFLDGGVEAFAFTFG